MKLIIDLCLIGSTLLLLSLPLDAQRPNYRRRYNYRHNPYSQRLQHHRRQRDSNPRNAPTSGWGSWSSWSRCSQSCGGGVREQNRNCRRGYMTDGMRLPCFGSNKKYELCNKNACADGFMHTRRHMCATYNNKTFGGNHYTWVPLNKGGPCQLNCQTRDQLFFIRHSTTVVDGTDCLITRRKSGKNESTSSGKGICIAGRCETMGCDGVHASGLKIDNCGVCGGNEQSCQYLHGLFRSQPRTNEYHLVVTVPAGASRINITEQYKSRSYLALRSAAPGNQFYINGDLNRGAPDRSGNYDDVASTRFVYQRPFLSEKGESLQSLGPTSEALDIMIFYQGENPGILYEYTVPKPGWVANQPQGSTPTEGSINRQSPHYLENQNYFSRHPNSRVDPSLSYNPPLGPVYPSRSNVQYNNNRGRPDYPTRLNVDGRYNYWPKVSIPEPETDTENVDSEPADESTNIRRDVIQISRQITVNGDTEWRLKGFGPCSKSCAGGVQVQEYDCVVSETGQVVQDHLCSSPKPDSREQTCGKKPCPAYWDTGSWSECTRTCGNGRRSRRIICRRQYADDVSTAVFHKRCSRLNKPKMYERCNVQPCARWVYVGGWGKCNTKCGSGSQTRQVACMARGNSEHLAESLCANSRTMSATRPCDGGPCITQWFTTKWQTCSADCGKGKQLRNVVCLNTAESSSGCPADSEPNSTRPCSRSSCGVTYEWFTGKWGACSSNCGNGVQKRKVTCLRITPDGAMEVVPENSTHCIESEKPDLEQNCNTQSCGSRWHFSPWSECSVSCGGGSRTRDVQCLDEQGNYNSLCDIDEKPIHAEKCNTVSCHSLIDPDCEDRLRSSCRMVLKARLCGYPYYKKACCHTCTLGRNSWHV